MFNRLITLNLCKYIQALNHTGLSDLHKEKNTLHHKFSVTDVKGLQLISESLETGLK